MKSQPIRIMSSHKARFVEELFNYIDKTKGSWETNWLLLRDGPLEKLWGGGEVQTKFVQGKIGRKKNFMHSNE